MSLIDCLAQIPLKEDERRIYDDLIAQKVADGMPEDQAQREAIESRIAELGQDKTDVQSKVAEAMEADTAPQRDTLLEQEVAAEKPGVIGQLKEFFKQLSAKKEPIAEPAPTVTEKEAAPTGPQADAVDPAEAWTEQHAVLAATLNSEQTQAMAPEPDTDPLTGLYTDIELMSALDRARASEQAHTYAESDTFNLGGMNSFLGANVRADAVLKQIAEAYAAAFPDMPVFRRGAGRLSAIVPADFDIDAATAQVESEVARISEENGLTNIPAPKVAGATGIGIYSGKQEILSGETTGETIGSVQEAINAAMPQEEGNVNRIEAFETWVDSSSGQAGRVAASIAAESPAGKGGEQERAGAPSLEALNRAASQPINPSAGEAVVSPDVFRQNTFEQVSKDVELTPEQAAPFTPTTHRDTLTGWFTARDLKPTLGRVQQFVEDTGGDASYIVADISNLGGLNLALGHNVADSVFTNMANIVAERAADIPGAEVIPFRHGGDEVSFIVTGASPDAISAAMDQASAEVAGYIEAVGLQDLPHAKDVTDKARAGSGVYIGIQDTGGGGRTIDEVIDSADAEVEFKKKQPKAEPVPVQLKEARELFQADTAPAVDTPAFKKWFGESTVVDDKGEPLVVYHGTPADVTEDFAFDYTKIGEQGRAEGAGFYFTENKDIASGYAEDGSVIQAYMSIQNPIEFDQDGFPAEQMAGIVKRVAEIEAEKEGADIADGFLSNYGDVNYQGLESVVNEAAEMLADEDKAVDQLGGIIGSGVEVDVLNKAVNEITGHDGFTSEGFSGMGGDKIHVAFFPEQIKSVEAEKFDPTDPRILHQAAEPAPIFYSQMQQVLADKLPGSGSPAQIKQVIEAMAKKGQFKQEELEWSGVSEWLDEQTGKVSKQDVINFLEANQIQVAEVEKGGVAEATVDALLEDELGEGMTREEAREYLDNDEGVEAKFAAYQLPGGKEYRELLLTLPETKVVPDVVYTEENVIFDSEAKDPAATNPDMFWYFKVPDNYFQIPKSKYDNWEDAKAYIIREKQPEIIPSEKDYRGGHYDEPNILAHIRYNERTDADGKKVLFVEEVQSDWHQAGRKEGYTRELTSAEQAEFDSLVAEKKALFDKHGGAKAVIIGGKQPGASSELKADFEKVTDLRIRINDLASISGTREGGETTGAVPNAPFKTTWPLLAMKRMIRHAAENGFDSIAWTTGEQQAERYDLSKQVDTVSAARVESGIYSIDIEKDGNLVGQKKLSESELEGFVGKDLAQKIIDSKDVQEGFVTNFTGQDLKVGGEGMKTFYDKMLPSAVNKYVKKWGGKVGEADIQTEIGFDVILPNGKVVDTKDTKKLALASAGNFEGATIRPFGKESAHSLTITPDMAKAAMAGQPLFQKKEAEERARITFTELNESIIRLTKASDLSSFLHESGHLFLEMEARFADKFGQTEEQDVLLDWLGVKSFNEITVEHHEKFAETFEVYLKEGKAPSLALRDAFEAFKEWLKIIYKTMGLDDPRLSRAKLTPEIRGYMDRMLATEAEIQQAMANPAYDQLFLSKEQAGMTDEDWEKYQEQAQKVRRRSTATVDEKVMAEWRKRKTAEWREERATMADEELERMKELPVYQVLEVSAENPMDMEAVREELGIEPGMTAEQRYQSGEIVDLKNDSLLVMAAKRGGLNMDLWSQEGVDPEFMKDRKFNNQVFGRPIFRKDSGMTPDDLAEAANQLGYGRELSANDALDLVDRELSGEKVYTPEGYATQIDLEALEYQIDPDSPAPVERRETTPTERLLRKIASKDGEDPAAYVEFYGFTSVANMIEAIAEAEPIKKAAVKAAEARMVEKYGDILNDGSLEAEVREAIHNEEQAKLLLMEIKAIGKKAPAIDRDYLKAKAKTLIGSMTYKDIRPSKFYQAEVKAAKKAVAAETDAERLAAKTQQLANHYLYREALKTKNDMQKHRKQVRGYETREYPPTVVESSYAQNIRVLAKAYNMRQGEAGRDLDVQGVVAWMITQMEDPNNYVDLDIIDPYIHKMIAAQKEGLPVVYTLPKFDELTAAELRGLRDQLRHMRFVGGKLSDEGRAQMAARREKAAESVSKNSKKKLSPVHEKSKAQIVKEEILEFGYSHRRIGGIFETLDGFEEGGPMAAEYEVINDATNNFLKMTGDMAESMNDALKGILRKINSRRKVSITKEDGVEFSLTPRARFTLGLNWGNEGNREAVLEGLNNKFPDAYTENDVLAMLSTMSDVELDALNKVWASKETLWPELSKTEVNRKGVAPVKIAPASFVVNGVKLTGGHYKLHYRKDPADAARNDITVEKARNGTIKVATASSLHERVGSGGRQVDLELSHLFTDIQEQIHYIAYAELSDHLNAMFKGVKNPVVDSVMTGFGEKYYDNLVNTLSGLTQPEDPVRGLWKGLRFVRSNLTYGFLAGSIRNIVQQPIAITNAISQLGEASMIKGSLEFYRNPSRNWDEISKKSQFMRNRTALVNREAREQLMKIDALHPALGAMKSAAFLPQTFMDSLIAYPTWMAALGKYKAEHPGASEKEAIYYADDMVAKTIGSGLAKDLGGILTKGEAEKQITFMGTFFNLTYNLHVENAQLLKRGKIGPMEYARRLGWMAIAPAVLAVWLLDDIPEDDDEKLAHMLKEIGYYNMSSIFLLRDLASKMDGFSPSIPGLKFADGIVRVSSEAKGLITGDEEFDAETVASMIRGVQPLVPLPFSGQIARTLEGMSDEDQELWGALVEGKERN